MFGSHGEETAEGSGVKCGSAVEKREGIFPREIDCRGSLRLGFCLVHVKRIGENKAQYSISSPSSAMHFR